MTKQGQMTNDQAPMTNKVRWEPVPPWSLGFVPWSFCFSKALFRHFRFPDRAVRVVDEVVDLIEAAEEHRMTVDHDLVELGVLHGAREGREAGGLLAHPFDDDLHPRTGVRLLAGDAAGGSFFGRLLFGHGGGGECWWLVLVASWL